MENSKAFTVKTSKQTFKILSEQLYSDKYKAVMREIICNGLDANRAAGSTMPVEVVLDERSLMIRDHGLGMSHEKIMNTYTTFFDSDKTGDTESIGGMGIGSKSPFAYTKEFYIYSYQNNTKRSYKAEIKDGYPYLTLENLEHSNEGSGIKVVIPIKASDFNQFCDAGRAVSKYIPKDDINFNQDFGNKIEYKIPPSNDYNFYVEHDRLEEGVVLVLNNIGYPLRKEGEFASGKFKKIFRYLGLVVTLPDGAIEVSASRESISFTKATINYLKKYLDDVLEKMNKRVQEHLETLDNMFLAQTFILTFTGYGFGFNKDKWAYKGQIVPKNIELEPVVDDNTTFALIPHYIIDAVKNIKIEKNHKLEVIPRQYIRGDIRTVIYSDVKKKSIKRALEHNRLDVIGDVITVNGGLIEAINACKKFNIPYTEDGSLAKGGLIKLSSLPYPKPKTRQTINNNEFVVSSSYCLYLKNKSKIIINYANVDPNKYINVFISREKTLCNNFEEYELIIDLYRRLNADLEDKQFIYIPENQKKVTETNKNIQNIDDYVADIKALLINNPTFKLNTIVDYFRSKNNLFCSAIRNTNTEQLDNLKNAVTSTNLVKFIDLIAKASKGGLYTNNLQRKEKLLNIDIESSVMYQELQKLLEQLFIALPMLKDGAPQCKYIGYNHFNEYYKLINKYVKK